MHLARMLAAPLLATLMAVPGAAQVTPHQGLDETYRAFVAGYAALDPVLVAGLYAEDALYVSAGAPARIGREAILAGFRGFFDAVRRDGATLRLRFRIVERRVGDGAAWDLGYYHLSRVTGDSVGAASVGRFVTGIVRQPDGRWRFISDTFEGSDLAAWAAAERGIEP